VIGKAFKAAWTEIAAVNRNRGRTALATALLAVASEGSRDVEVLKDRIAENGGDL
jgi:hypothetical protein